jgi:hypothetical protein
MINWTLTVLLGATWFGFLFMAIYMLAETIRRRRFKLTAIVLAAAVVSLGALAVYDELRQRFFPQLFDGSNPDTIAVTMLSMGGFIAFAIYVRVRLGRERRF